MERDVANSVSDITHSSSGYDLWDFVKDKRNRDLLSSGLLRSDKCQFITDVSGHLSVLSSDIKNPALLTPEDEAYRLSRNVGTKLPYLLRKNPEKRSSHLLRGGSLKSRTVKDKFTVMFFTNKLPLT
jgi:hypothetical protein